MLRNFLLCLSLVSAFVYFTQSVFAQSPFTPADALEVQSLSNLSINANGNFVIGIQSKGGYNRLNVDHFRFLDPSYIRPFEGELVMYDVEKSTKSTIATGHVSNPAWSEDGKKVAFFKVEQNETHLYLYDLSKKTAAKVPLKTDKKISSNASIQWFADGQAVLVNLRAKDWLEKGMAMYNEATSDAVTVYDSEEPFLKWDAIRNHDNKEIIAKVDLTNGAVTELLPEGFYRNIQIDDKGTFIAYEENMPIKTSYNRRDGTEYEWKLLPLNEDSEAKSLIAKVKQSKRLYWSDDETWIAWADSGHVFVRPALVDTAINLTKDKNLIIAGEDTTKVEFSVDMWNQEATKLIARSKQGYWLIDREAKTVERFIEFPEKEKNVPDMRALAWQPARRYLYLTYSASDKWERGMVRYDFQDGTLEDLLKDEKVYRSWAMAKNGSRFIFERSDGDRPEDLFVIDNDFKSAKQLSDLNPWVKDKKFTRSELVKYLDVDGNELYGILYYPVDYDSTKKYPLVCEIYERFFDNGYRNSMNIIANAGYFGFRPSVNLEEGRPGEAWIKGVTSGINKLIERGLVDPKKIGVHGTSYGGYAASLLIAQTNRFAAAINISGKTNIISFLGDSPRIGTRNYAAAEVGQDRIGETLWEAPMKYYEHSAVMFADRMNTPHLLLTGEGDWNVPAANTRELYYALRRLGKKVVWVNYKNAGHGAGWAGTKSDYFDQWERILGWYAEHFADKSDNKEGKTASTGQE